MTRKLTILAGALAAFATSCTYVVEESSGDGQGDSEQITISTSCATEREGNHITVVCTDSNGTKSVKGNIDLVPTGAVGSVELIDSEETNHDDGSPDAGAGALPLIPVATQTCVESDSSSLSWSTTPSSHFQINTLEGSKAHRNVASIAEQYESSYEAIRTALSLEDAPSIALFLSPDRNAAEQHGKAWGRSFFDDRIEAIWTGSSKDYHRQHPGYLTAITLLRHKIPAERYAIPLLAMGLAEYLDQSERDLHVEYAVELVTQSESRARIAEFTDAEVSYGNGTLGGSLVSLLVQELGLPNVVELLVESQLSWSDDAFQHEEVGAVDSAAQLDRVLEDTLRKMDGPSWSDLKEQWRETILTTLASPLPVVSSEDRAEIVNLVRVADAALNSDKSEMYRSVLDGFYCVGRDETARMELSKTMVGAYDNAQTTVLRIYPTHARNFPTAKVVATRKDGVNTVTNTYYTVENFEAGWRITGAPEWPR